MDKIVVTTDGHVVAVPVRTTSPLQLGAAATLFAVPERAAWGDFAVSADGQRLLSISADRRGSEQPLTIILNWPAEIARR